MTLNDNATVVPATGNYWFAPTQGQARPSNALAPASPWVNLGHTKLDGPFEIGSEGGDRTTQGTWQNKSLREVIAPLVEWLNIELKQWDEYSLKMYQGSNSAISSTGAVRKPANPAPTLGALFVLIADGVDHVAGYWPSVSILRADDISMDAEDLAGLPVRATVLGVSGQDWLYEISPKGNLGALSIDVLPATSSKAAAQTTQLAVTATYPDTTTAVVTTLTTYSSSDVTKATVSAGGLITHVATGTATITCTYQGRTDTVAVTTS